MGFNGQKNSSMLENMLAQKIVWDKPKFAVEIW
jgi:hypothetical protein